jgi:hypothetical protein
VHSPPACWPCSPSSSAYPPATWWRKAVVATVPNSVPTGFAGTPRATRPDRGITSRLVHTCWRRAWRPCSERSRTLSRPRIQLKVSLGSSMRQLERCTRPPMCSPRILRCLSSNDCCSRASKLMRPSRSAATYPTSAERTFPEGWSSRSPRIASDTVGWLRSMAGVLRRPGGIRS